MSNILRLDAAESAFFARQLEAVDTELYSQIYPDNIARTLIPTQPNIPDWARVYTWRTFDKFGKARLVANMADDLPRADISGSEESKVIKPIAASYGWDIFEVKAASKTNTPLDSLKAVAARFAVETEIDSLLALGSTAHNMQGLLTLSNTTTFTPFTKGVGGTSWLTGGVTGDEMARDVFGLVAKIVVAMKNAGGAVFQRFQIVMPIEQYSLIAQKRMGDGSDKTVLRFILENSPFVEAITPWHLATGAGGSSTDRMVAYPKNPLVLAGLVPTEFTSLPPEQRNMEYVVNCYATVGGVICRYPVAVGYCDGI